MRPYDGARGRGFLCLCKEFDFNSCIRHARYNIVLDYYIENRSKTDVNKSNAQIKVRMCIIQVPE